MVALNTSSYLFSVKKNDLKWNQDGGESTEIYEIKY